MWFKTRVDLGHICTDFEIRACYRRETGGWWIAAYARSGEAEGKSFFKSFSFGGSWFYLAALPGGAEAEKEIARAMEIIAKAVESGATICDLTEVGTDEAWGGRWQPIRWPAR